MIQLQQTQGDTKKSLPNSGGSVASETPTIEAGFPAQGSSVVPEMSVLDPRESENELPKNQLFPENKVGKSSTILENERLSRPLDPTVEYGLPHAEVSPSTNTLVDVSSQDPDTAKNEYQKYFLNNAVSGSIDKTGNNNPFFTPADKIVSGLSA
jgi:hypothetical protein